jgi:hypothetical protein
LVQVDGAAAAGVVGLVTGALRPLGIGEPLVEDLEAPLALRDLARAVVEFVAVAVVVAAAVVAEAAAVVQAAVAVAVAVAVVAVAVVAVVAVAAEVGAATAAAVSGCSPVHPHEYTGCI